jgi:hypothetical protein
MLTFMNKKIHMAGFMNKMFPWPHFDVDAMKGVRSTFIVD